MKPAIDPERLARDIQDILDWDDFAALQERESHLYFATLENGALVIQDPSSWCTSIDDARTELVKWEQQCRDEGKEHLIPSLRVVRGLTNPIELFCGSARRVSA